jgi:hypothetical protein
VPISWKASVSDAAANTTTSPLRLFVTGFAAAGALGPEDPRVAVGLANIAALRREQGACDEARAMLDRALRIFMRQPSRYAAAILSVQAALRRAGDYVASLAPDARLRPGPSLRVEVGASGTMGGRYA